MSSARKERERLEREDRFLAAARRILLERGYLGLTMDRVAAATEYAKGTVYLHFSSKEDLVAAIQIGIVEQRAEFFRRASRFRGTSRERIAAIGVADEVLGRLYPEHDRLEQVLDVAAIFEKVSEERRIQLRTAKNRLMDALEAIVLDAVDDGDLVLPEGLPWCVVVYGLWTMAVGHSQVMATGHAPLHHFGDLDVRTALWRCYDALLDGWNWKPLSSERDYRAVVDRVHDEVFPDERRRIDAAG